MTAAPAPISRADAARTLLAIRAAENSFLDFVRFVRPTYKLQPMHLELIEKLDMLERGALIAPTGAPIRRILINAPPRSGKTEIATRLFSAYALGRKPMRKIMQASYSSDLAKKFGGDARDVVVDPAVRQVFPDLALRDDMSAKDEWGTTKGGGYVGRGFGASTVGLPANILIVDDPVKNRQEADSPTRREDVRSYYAGSLTTRKEPTLDGDRPFEIVILTRWHPEDLAGFIQSTKDWKDGLWAHVAYSAIVESDTDVEVSRRDLPKDDPRYLAAELNSVTRSQRYVRLKTEKSFWDDRYPLEDLKRQRDLDPREFAAQYQQSPYVQGGNILKETWWRYYDKAQLDYSQLSAIIIVWDTAFKAKEQNDPSCALVMGLHRNGDILVLDCICERLDFPDLKARAITLNNLWRGRGLRGVYIEDKASGQSLIQELQRASGIAVIPHKVVFDKVARLNAVTPLIQGGRVYLPKDERWVDAFVQECLEFPSSAHDDQVDALSMGLDILSKMGLGAQEMYAPIDLATSLVRGNSLFDGGKSLAQLGKDFETLYPPLAA